MKPSTSLPSYRDALEVLDNLGRDFNRAAFQVALSGSSGVWEVRALGYQSPAMAALIRAAGVRLTGSTPFPESHSIHHEHVGYRGRTRIGIVAVETVIHRVDGVTGFEVPDPTLW